MRNAVLRGDLNRSRSIVFMATDTNTSAAGVTDKSPWRLQAKQSDHGETSVICDANGFVICAIPAPIWDAAAAIDHPQDAAHARLIVASPNLLKALRKAEKALDILAEAHEQETNSHEAGGWATDALREVSKAIRSVG